jgi:ribosomal protein S12 methylthiotransferase accessory factor
VSQGKGLTLAHAFASALMEAVEGFHAEDLEARFRMASVQELADSYVVDHRRLCGTGEPLADDGQISWIEGVDLASGRPCWVPAEAIHLDTTLPVKPGSGHFLGGSNGLASGNHPLEAISSAICEVIERDAVALWDARRAGERGPIRLDLTSVDDPDCSSLLEGYAKARMAVRAWNVTSDIGVACFVCDIFPEVEDPSVDLPRFRGTGCHPDRAVALARALTEAAQVRVTHITGIRDDLPPSEYRKAPRERLGAALLDYLSSKVEPCSFREAPTYETDDLAAEVRWALERLTHAGAAQVVAVDLTRPEYGIPVVKVLVPGLEGNPSHPDYSPGPRARAARGVSA